MNPKVAGDLHAEVARMIRAGQTDEVAEALEMVLGELCGAVPPHSDDPQDQQEKLYKALKAALQPPTKSAAQAWSERHGTTRQVDPKQPTRPNPDWRPHP